MSNGGTVADGDLQQKLEYYKSARNEMISRIALRDQSLIAYIASAGAYFGFFVQGRQISQGQNLDILTNSLIVMVLPILSLVFTYVISQHHYMIGKLGEFTRALFPQGQQHWDHAYSSWKDKRYLSARTASQSLLLVLPVAFVTMYFAQTILAPHTMLEQYVSTSALVINAVILFLIVRVQFWSHSNRDITDRNHAK